MASRMLPVLVCYLAAGIAAAQDPAPYDGEFTTLTPYVLYYEDPGASMTIDDVRALEDAAFTRNDVTDVARTFTFVEAPAILGVTGKRFFLGTT